VAALFRTPVVVVFVDEDNQELARVRDAPFVPRVGENVRLNGAPYLVERVGYDVPAEEIEKAFVVCQALS
jgi:hypothetical protein